jgi:hypothetical protein
VRNTGQVVDTIQCAKIGEGAIEQFASGEIADLFGTKDQRPHQFLHSALLNPARCHVDHLRRRVAGKHSDIAFRQETRVDTRSTSDIQDVIAGPECLRQLTPNSPALSPSDGRRGEGLVVSSRDGVKWSG